ncbi:MAG: chemotaxis protein, partial [Bdellovibrio sp.]|nr:chemotaxis protein [Bdellovibrio sp.]
SQALQGLGFSSYEDFMMQALVAELDSRDASLKYVKAEGLKTAIFDRRVGDIMIASSHCTDSARNGFKITGQLYSNLSKLMDQVGVISETCDKVKFITTNMTISSSKLGEFGRPLVVVSSNLEKLTGEIAACVGNLQEALNQFKNSVFQMHFTLAASRLQIEMMHHFILEMARTPKEQDPRVEEFFTNCNLLNQLVAQNFSQVESTCAELGKVSRSLLSTIERLTQVTAGMDVIRIVGKIEVARVEGLSDTLTSRLAEIEELTISFKDSLRVLKSECLWGITSSSRITTLTKDIGDRLDYMTAIIAI